MAIIQLINISNKDIPQHMITIFFTSDVIPFQAEIPLDRSVNKLTNKQKTPIAVSLELKLLAESVPKKRKIHPKLPGLFEYLCIQQKDIKRIMIVIITMNMTSKTANLKNSLLFAQRFDYPYPAKDTTRMIPARIKSIEKNIQNTVLLNQALHLLQSIAKILAASIIQLTTTINLKNELLQVELSREEIQFAMMVETES